MSFFAFKTCFVTLFEIKMRGKQCLFNQETAGNI